MLKITTFLFLAINLITLCRAQFLSFKDGKIGVNFGGYHAEAGLGALLTGNAAHGGLSASAGTPYGQRAAAGIGAGTAENSQGGAYANANAGGNVGASAGLGGVVGGEAGLGAEAHAGSLSSSASGNSRQGFQVSKTTNNNAINRNRNYGGYGQEFGGDIQAQTTQYTNMFDNDNKIIAQESNIQRIKPPKKFTRRVHGNARVAQPSNTVAVVNKAVEVKPQEVYVEPAVQAVKTVTKTKTVSPAVVYQQESQPAFFDYNKSVYVGGGGGAGGGAVSGTGYSGGSVSGHFNAQGLFDSIFNIPIQTLKAVNGLVNNVAGSVSASGNVAVAKTKTVGVSSSY